MAQILGSRFAGGESGRDASAKTILQTNENNLNLSNMKTTNLTFTFLLTTVMVVAQTSEHLNFKGVPIDGTLNEYVMKMKLNGFTHSGTDDGTAILKGDFAGYKDCYIGVSTLKQKDLVYKIVVIFPERETWSTLSGNYFELKQMLTEKYEEPTDVVEKFDGSYSQSMDDNSKMYEVQFDRCKYYSIWRTDKGEIQLSIEHDGVVSCYIKLLYLDKINSAIIRSNAKGDL